MSSVSSPPMALPEKSYLNNENGLRSWLLTRDHKRIALLYLLTMAFFFAIGGTAAAIIRLELFVRVRPFVPDNRNVTSTLFKSPGANPGKGRSSWRALPRM
jgi:hypothetical protein